jgi:hypothetical protein
MTEIQFCEDPYDPTKSIFAIPKNMTREQLMNSYLKYDVTIIKEAEDNNIDITNISKHQILDQVLKQRIKILKDKRTRKRNK